LKKFSLPLILLLLLSACKSEPAIPEFGSLIIDEISELDCDPEEENCAYISINIPWAKERGSRNKRINENIEQHVINLVDFQEKNNFNNLRDLSKSFISNYESSATDFPEYNIPWEASIEGRVLSSNQNLISLEFDLAMFTGGAHGFTSISFLNFEPATGNILSHDDLFTSEFKNYAEEIFRKEYGIPADDPINSTGYFFENDTFHLPDNIGFLEDKIILRYNAYEVASYSEGGIQLEIPMDEGGRFVKI